ncbi:homogenitisate phytyltransferase [Micromonospora sp. KC606]|uniref:UbiA family prenyltransferase n=1 Tax=Micromonospora sp. KC606 TaxID=2530379 RepID=UPI0010508899|nr:UbiA family prenyltransferase [Micromonospora sp. KC606]TDC76451.1 homogenitisate phytyltransferase [Micromonospora sp. KC606]
MTYHSVIRPDRSFRIEGLVRPSAPIIVAVAEGGRHVSASWREARPVVQVIFQLRFLAGAAVAAPQGIVTRPATLLLGALAWLCATWCVYLLNGLSDQVEDRRNGSTRPLATGALPAGVARRIVIGLAAVALALAGVVSPRMAGLVALMLALGWLYSAGPHPQKGNMLGFVLVVAAGGIVTYLAGSAAAGGPVKPDLMVMMVAMSLWMALAGTTKDLSDVAGDRAAGRRTLPVLLGDRGARRLMAGLVVVAGGVLLVGALLVAPALVAPATVLAVGAAAVVGCVLTGAGATDRRRQRRPYRIFMASQYAVHLMVLGLFLL